MNRLKAERDEIEGKLAAFETSKNVITLHPAALERYRRDIEQLAGLLPRPDLENVDELGESVRRLVSAVIVTAPANSEKLEVEIKGRLDELLSIPSPFSHRSKGPQDYDSRTWAYDDIKIVVALVFDPHAEFQRRKLAQEPRSRSRIRLTGYGTRRKRRSKQLLTMVDKTSTGHRSHQLS